jgi:pimeloyl-ACP methyl ester carboxylesterase
MPRDKPVTPIVLVPGLLCSAEIFAPQVAALWPYGPVTVASTLTGSDIAQMAATILATAPDRFALAGVSMGGYIAMEIMRQAPERVTRLALLDTQAGADAPEQSQFRRALVEKARAGDFETLATDALMSLMHPARQQDAALRAISRRMALAVGMDSFARQVEAIISRPDSRPGLGAIKVPVLVLVGAQDALTPLAKSQEIADAIPGAKLVVIEESGHCTTMEQPEAVNRALVEWIAG